MRVNVTPHSFLNFFNLKLVTLTKLPVHSLKYIHMKLITNKITSLLFACVVILAVVGFKAAEVPKIKPHTYTGYWIAKSGAEYIEMGKTNLPDDAFDKDAKGKINHIDKDRVKAKLRFSEEGRIHGKLIESHYLVIVEDEQAIDQTNDLNNLLSVSVNGNTAIKSAIMVCEGRSVAGWSAMKCHSGVNNYCLSVSAFGGNYYVLCDN